MSAKENPCRKFQANIFNKSKCQNCFRPRESHALIDEDLSQAKPIYGGWLLLAPEGTDFDNPVQRSRKWQRRFFILYEHGLLRYALDEMPSTLPQGTINMNQCLDVVDGEKRTSQKNSLCVVTPEKEHFIRAENKEIINGWFETLIVYPRTNKQNQKKKRKVEPPTPQEGPHTSAPLSSGDMNGHIEPGPAKVAVTSSGASSSTLTTILSVEKVPSSKSTLWQEEPRGRSHIPCSRSTPSLCQLSQASVPPAVTTRAPKAESESGSTEHVDGGRKARVESGYFSLEKTKPEAKTPEETLPQPPQHLQYASPSRYSYPDAESPNPCRSPEYSDPFLSPGPFHSNGSSAISSSQSSLDSEASSTTQTSGASWESRGAGGGGTQIEKTGACQASRNTREYATLADIPKAKRISNRDAFQVERKRLEQRTRARSPGREEVVRLFGQERRRSQVIEKFETLDVENAENMETSSAAIAESSSSEPQGTCVGSTRLGRSARRAFPRKQEFTMEASKGGSVPEASSLPVSPYRRAKSLDRRTTESSITPDLLNFKKGWMTKLYQDGVWKKHWFVLTDQSLRFYRDSIAEEAADLDGEIDLSTCFDVTEFPVQRNYGFQIHTKDRVFTLSAMTSGIRRNWVQAITKSIRPSTAPDVTSSLPEEKAVAKPSSDTRVTVDGTSEVDGSHAVKKAGARERRRDGRSKTFDWAEFRPTQQLLAQEREPAMAEVPVSPPVGPAAPVEAQPRTNASAVTDLEKERAWRREVRRKRFETADVSFVSNQDDAKFQMEVDRSQAVVLESKSPSVRVEIEERWHQVETTPLREEKQIPISTLHSSAPVSESVPPQDLAPLLLDKELEQTQKELRSLQHQNRLLQEQLKEAQSREQNAREGYVLQTDATQMGAWHRLHKLNQDLQTELDSQRQRQDLTNQQVQTLKQNYGQVKEIIRQRELEIQKLQDKLSNAMAEIDASEQTVGKMRRELQAEQDKFKERAGEWEHDGETLQSQLKESEARLREVEALLLEKSQALRDLERQQALQRDHQKDALKLQGRLTEATKQLAAMEQARVLNEERRQKSYDFVKESHEKEKEALSRSLREAEEKVRDFEERLQKAECQREDAQKEKRSATLEYSEIVHHLEEELLTKNTSIQKLTQNMRDLQMEKDQLECKCQELIHQLSEADGEALKLQSRLKTEETDYYNLEHSYEKVSEEIQKVHQVLREKEVEIKEVQMRYDRLVEKKDRDLNEALVKMAALGSSLEETESKLRAKEELISQLDGREGKLAAAELRVEEPQVSYYELQVQGACSEHDSGVKSSQISSPPKEGVGAKAESDPDASVCKRQRIRFASIYCQKYEGDKPLASNASSDASQGGSTLDRSPFTSTEGDPGRFISVIHSLEEKLYVTEEKLKEITLKVEEEQSRRLDSVMEQQSRWAQTEHELRQHLDASLSEIAGLKAELQGEVDTHVSVLQEARCRMGVATGICEKALASIESSREKIQQVLGCQQGVEVGTLHCMLQEASDELVNATKCLKQQGALLEECMLNGREATASVASTEDKMNVLTRMLAFEALLLNKMAASVESETSQEVGKLENSKQTAAAYADVLTQKLVWESELWAEGDGESRSGTLEEQMADRAVWAARVTSESSLRLQHLKLLYQRQMEEPKGQVKSRQHQGVRGAVGEAALLADITPPELAPYAEQIQMQEAHSLAVQVVEKHLGQDGSRGRGEARGGEKFAAALRRQAQLLQPLSRDIESPFTPQTFAWAAHGIPDALCRSSSVVVREAVVQAQIAYVACKLRVQHDEELRQCKDAYGSMEVLCQEHVKNITSIQERYDKALLEERCAYEAAVARLKEENEALRAEASRHLSEISRQQQKLFDVEEGFTRDMEELKYKCRSELQEARQKQAAGEAESQRRLEEMQGDVERAEERHRQHIRTLEEDLHRRILELQEIHEEEMQRLHGHYTRASLEGHGAEQLASPPPEVEARRLVEERDLDAMAVLKERILELETQRDVMRGELVEHKHLEGDLLGLRDRHQTDLEKLKATCERGFAAMEETHQKVIEDIHRQHQRELDKLLEEKERLLAEETAATIAAIEAMKNAHRVELEKTQRAQITGMSADIEELRRQYQEELQSLYRELEVLSQQYSQKCLENAHLAQALEAERQALQQCQRENQELNAHNQELNTRLAAEITRLRSCITGEGGDVPLTQGKDSYELEVLLRVKESEIQYLKQEIHSLKDELQTALKDKKYATDKYKDIYTELSIAKAKADCDISKLKEQLIVATEALGDTAGGSGAMSGYDIMKSKSNPDFLKKERASASRQTRSSRSKSLKEGLTVQERLKLFEAMDSKKV